MKIKEIYENIIAFLIENFTAICEKSEKASKMTEEVKRISENIKKDTDALWKSIRQHRQHEGTRYVLVNPDGELDSYFFNDQNYDSKLREFYTTADIKTGDRLYMVNNYYEEKTFVVCYRIYSPSKNTMFLKVKEYNKDNSYADSDWCYTEEFDKRVRKMAADEVYTERAKREFKKYHNCDEENEDEIEKEFEDRKLDLVAWQIAEQIDREHRTYLQFDCIKYRVQVILYKDVGKEWHKPHRWEYSDF